MGNKSSGQRLHIVGDGGPSNTEELTPQAPIILPARIIIGGTFEAIFSEYNVTFLQGTGTVRLGLDEAIGIGLFAQGILEKMAADETPELTEA